MTSRELAAIEQAIQVEANGMIDRWARDAADRGVDVEAFIGDRLDELEQTEPTVCQVVGQVWLVRRFARWDRRLPEPLRREG